MVSPRLLFAAPASGSGKTTIVCGLLRALKNRGKGVRVKVYILVEIVLPVFH